MNHRKWRQPEQENYIMKDVVASNWQLVCETRVGTRWLLVRQFLGIKIKGISEVVEYEPNRKLVKKSPDGPMPGTSTILFEPANGGTKLHFTVNFETKGFLKLLDRCWRRCLFPRVEQTCEN
jgi:hypothetical protein